jgi:hypothetical protein
MLSKTIIEIVGLQSANDDLSPLDPLTESMLCSTYCKGTYSDKDEVNS